MVSNLSPEQIIGVIIAIYLVIAGAIGAIIFTRTSKARLLAKLASRLSIRSTQGSAIQKHSQSISDALKELRDYRNKKNSKAVSRLIYAAGLEIRPAVFVTFWVGFVVAAEVMLLVLNVSAVINLLAFLGAAFAPYVILRQMAKRLQQKFSDEFASAVDVIIRGVRSGLPVNSCFKIVSQEGPDAVRGQFRKLFNDLDLGVPLIAAMERFAERIDLPEVKFFTIVISVQSTTGGNLSSALENLSNLLRERKQLNGKIKALSSEAKTSSWIIGALPVLVLGIVQIVSPQYSSVLFVSTTGQLILGGSALWMVAGVIVMARMIDLEM